MNGKTLGKLEFINHDATTHDAIHCTIDSIEPIMQWYGAFCAGDDYMVLFDGCEVAFDQNGEKEPLVIDGDIEQRVADIERFLVL